MSRKKIRWEPGDVFVVPLSNGEVSVGQALGQSMPNSVRIALYDEKFKVDEVPSIDLLCIENKLISLIEVTKEQLTYGVWKIIGSKAVQIPLQRQPNEQFRNARWAGASFSDAGLAEDFLNAFHALRPWDNWYDPKYLDNYLVDLSKKPDEVIYVKN